MKLILPEQITEAQYKAYLADWGAERIVPIASANAAGATPKCSVRSRCLSHMPWVEGAHHLRRRFERKK